MAYCSYERIKNVTANWQDDDLNEAQALLLQNPTLGRAVHDLACVLSIHGTAAVSCARALEALRRIMFTQDDPTRKLGWAFMQEQLNVDSSYCKSITDISIEPRHGSHRTVDEAKAEDALVRTWEIFNRYFEYMKRDRDRLPLSEFPLLS